LTDSRYADVAPVLLPTARFYDWEVRGRGWHVWPYPVDLEPPFLAFPGHLGPTLASIDDGRRPTAVSSFIDALLSRSDQPSLPALVPAPDEPDAEPFDASGSELVELQVALPEDTNVSPAAAQQLLLSLSACEHPIAVEVVGRGERIFVQLATRDCDCVFAAQQLAGQFPTAVVTSQTNWLLDAWKLRRGSHSLVVDFGLSEEFFRPLRTFTRFNTDPLTSLVAALSRLEAGEIGMFQVLLSPARRSWVPSIARALTTADGEPFFVDAPEMIPLAKDKIASPLFAAVVRVAAQSNNASRTLAIARGLGGALKQFGTPDSNELIPLTDDGYPKDVHERDLLARLSRRTGMLLNVEELAALAHLPSVVVSSERLVRTSKRTRRAPADAQGHALQLGVNVHAGRRQSVAVAPETRLRHMHIVGASGTGKSTLMLDLILQDLAMGSGIAVLDPHGDLIDQVAGNVPESRVPDVILVDPSDLECPIAFNILSAHSELEKMLLSSDLVGIFRRLSTSWGDQMTSVLGNAVLAFLESTRGGSLVDLRRFLIEPEFRADFLESVTDSEVVYYWRKEFPLLVGRPQAPLLTRLDTFLRPKPVRAMMAQPDNRLDLSSAMNDGKVLLIKLSQGAIGIENAALLGSLFTAKFQQLVMGRQEVAEAARRPFFLYIDEFHNFITPSIASLLTGARKYRLGLVLAHQDLTQLLNADRDVASAVLTNAATRVCFRVGDEDARRLEGGFGSFDRKDLLNLKRGEAICRIDRSDADFNIETTMPRLADESTAAARRSQIQADTREAYGRRIQPTPVPVATSPTQVPPAAAPTAPRPAPVTSHPPPSVPVPTSGRGGAQHKYLQHLIKRWCEEHGFHVAIEQEVLDGLGSVDVAITKGERRIACEISVSTTTDHELGNVRKCLAVGFDQVFLIAADKRRIGTLRKTAAAQVEADLLDRVQVVSPEELFEQLSTPENVPVETTTTVRGYRVKLQQAQTRPDTSRRQAVAKTIADAMKRLKR
jgi:hypothetical protein